MKVFIAVLVFFIVQCSNVSDRRSGFLFEDWRKSVIDSITSTTLLEDYQKEILLIQAKEITKENYDNLTSIVSMNGVYDYHLILYYSSGEVVNTFFGGIVRGRDSINFVFIDGESSSNDIIVRNLSDNRINELLSKEDSDYMILDPIVVISWMSDRGVILSKVKTIKGHL